MLSFCLLWKIDHLFCLQHSKMEIGLKLSGWDFRSSSLHKIQSLHVTCQVALKLYDCQTYQKSNMYHLTQCHTDNAIFHQKCSISRLLSPRRFALADSTIYTLMLKNCFTKAQKAHFLEVKNIFNAHKLLMLSIS